MRRVLRGESVLVLLPTGAGKSAVFQLAALVQPGTGLVVAPLNALIQDQMNHLEEVGVAAAVSTSRISPISSSRNSRR